MGKTTEEKIDTIGREEIIKSLSNIVESVSYNKGNTTFALDGVWGCGKTFVLEELEKRLSSVQKEETADNRYFIIHYNSWKYDYYEEPLVAIVSSIVSSLDENRIIKNPKTRTAVKEVLKKIATALLQSANDSIKKFTGIDVKEKVEPIIQEAKEIKNKSEDKIKENNKYDGYFDLKKLLKQLNKSLSQLSEQYTIVLIVDELDRCLPEYAIKVLERLHHLTEDVENIVTIIGTDNSKLKGIVGKTFGFGEHDCSKYLKKFIKFSLKLNIGTSQESIKEKYAHYMSLFNQDFLKDNIDFTEFFNVLFEKIDVREQENLMEKVFMLHTLLTKEKMDTSIMYTELILLVMEHYEILLSDLLSSGKFKNISGDKEKEYPRLEKLNSLFEILMRETLNMSNGRRRFIINKDSENKGHIYWYIDCLKTNDSVEAYQGTWYQIEDRDKEYKKLCEKNYDFIKQFVNILKTIK